MTGTILKLVTLFLCAAVPAMQAQTSACDPADPLDQGWDCQTQYKFWYTPQGSWVIPYQWLSALQVAKNGKVVRFASLLTSDYGYIDAPPDVPLQLNPGKLPIGFVKDGTAAKPYLGMTCAACHTARIVLGGQPVLVNGAPSNGDFYTFLSDLVMALKQTQSDRFDTFAQEVGGDPVQLKRDLATELKSLQDRAARNLPLQPYGRGRVDAFGHIFNQVVISSRQSWPAIAPVSYPALWRSPRMDLVQWNGSASNSGQGPFLRNIGEALGVFGRIWVNIGDSGYGIRSTIRAAGHEEP